MTGVTPLPPQNATTALVVAQAEHPGGLGDLEHVAPATWSLNQSDTSPPGTRLTVTVRSASVPGALDIE